jgi:hypothetical protein
MYPFVKMGFHDAALVAKTWPSVLGHYDTRFIYRFENFFHPFVGELIAKLNRESLGGMLDAAWQESLTTADPQTDPAHDFFAVTYGPNRTKLVDVESLPMEIDTSSNGGYSIYNWELFFHLPLTIAVHLSKNQRFAEAQRWFHYIFDPTAHDSKLPSRQRFWKFIGFRKQTGQMRIEEIVRILSIPRSALSAADQVFQDDALRALDMTRAEPFRPHAIARTRELAYQYCVVMKYLDNLIAWGDTLFQQDTLESINEATQIYILAANVLGQRPQRIPPRGTVKVRSFAQLKAQGLGAIGDALTDLQAQFPFNLALPGGAAASAEGDTNALFGIGRALYFCVPTNDKLLGYWDVVDDRLFKIRHCMNIQGIVRPLALFDPPIDPGLLVKAVAAGLDIGNVINGLNRPPGPFRTPLMLQKTLELCAEVRGLGNSLLSLLEKREVEQLALLRQRHEIRMRQMSQELRFLQWKQAERATSNLLESRKMSLDRLNFYRRLVGVPADPNATESVALDRRELTAQNFEEAYAALVGQYDKQLTLQALPELKRAGDSSPGILSGYSGSGKVYLSKNEDTELNVHLPIARDTTLLSSVLHSLAATLVPIPDAKANLHFWGLGGTIDLKVGTALSTISRIAGDVAGMVASWERDQASMAARYASYERRADEWLHQYNQAARDLEQNGRQLLTSLMAEQAAHREHVTAQGQVEQAQEIDQFLHDKFVNEEQIGWMQGEVTRLYYEYYRFAFDTARSTQDTMKRELMRPELDDRDFLQFNYWDAGRKGLLSGEALFLDVKRMELAYYDYNRRDLELTKTVSLRRLNPLALLTLKATGSCVVTVPEWLFDLDCPGHYMRRIKSVAVSIPAVVGPYTAVNCTLSLLSSSLRKAPVLKNGNYTRQEEDDRFEDYAGPIQTIVTSTGQNDSGLFERNLRDDRPLPFEWAGALSTWKIAIGGAYPCFDRQTIPDVLLQFQFTSRLGVDQDKVKTSLDDLFKTAGGNDLAILLSLKEDFSNEWEIFVAGSEDLSVSLGAEHFPYFATASGKSIELTSLVIYAGEDPTGKSRTLPVPADAAQRLSSRETVNIVMGEDAEIVRRDRMAIVQMIANYRLK